MNFTVGKVRIPLFAILAALPKAARKAHAVASDDRDPGSPGGVKTTPGEVTEAVAVFFAALAEEAGPAILGANGVN